MPIYILTEEQFAFMQRHKELVHYSMFSSEIGGRCYIDEIMSWPEWKLLFRDRGWDDVLDAYEETPGYDNSFHRLLWTWIIDNPHLSLPNKPYHMMRSSIYNKPRRSPEQELSASALDDDEDLMGAETLRRLRDTAINRSDE